MVKPVISLSTIGFVISGLGANSIASNASTAINSQVHDAEVAESLADMINRGHVKVDPKTGVLQINSDILSILEDYELVPQEIVPSSHAAGCGSTVGGDCMTRD